MKMQTNINEGISKHKTITREIKENKVGGKKDEEVYKNAKRRKEDEGIVNWGCIGKMK